MKLVLRTGGDGDYGFAVRTWLDSAWSDLRRPAYVAATKAHMNRALRAGSFAVACSEAEPSALFGWALAEAGALWWLYVSHDFRGLGLGRRLKERVLS